MSAYDTITEGFSKWENQMPQCACKVPIFEEKIIIEDESDILYSNADDAKKGPMFTQIRTQNSSSKLGTKQTKKTKIDGSKLFENSPPIKGG